MTTHGFLSGNRLKVGPGFRHRLRPLGPGETFARAMTRLLYILAAWPGGIRPPPPPRAIQIQSPANAVLPILVSLSLIGSKEGGASIPLVRGHRS